jgi:hypothetical protein
MGASTGTSTTTTAKSGTLYTVTSEDWAAVLLGAIKAPVTSNNIANVQRIIGAESGGNQAGFLRDNNPFNLNTYSTPHTSLPGGTIKQEFGIYVQTFPTIEAGVEATAAQFQDNPALLKAFQNNAPASVVGGALSTSAWSSAGYANATTFPTLNPFTGSQGGETTTEIGGTPSGITTVGDPSNVLGNTGTIAGSVADATGITYFVDLLKSIAGDGKNIAIFAGGFILAGVGLVLFISTTKEGKSAEKIGATAAVA